MMEFLSSNQGLMMLLVLGILGGVGFIILTVVESLLYDDFDPVCEAKCKKCICYDMCRHHGCMYECPDYMTEDMLKRKGVEQ